MNGLLTTPAQCDAMLAAAVLTRSQKTALLQRKAHLLAEAENKEDDPRDLGFGAELFGGFNQRPHETPVPLRRVVATVEFSLRFTHTSGDFLSDVSLPVLFNSLASLQNATITYGSVIQKAVSRYMGDSGAVGHGWPRIECWDYYSGQSLSPTVHNRPF